MSNTRKIRLTRPIILNREHAEEGSVHEVPRHVAQTLIGTDFAVEHVEEGEQPEPAPTSVTRMEHPTNADPAPRRIAGAKAKVKES
jgi:hypothetical protein